MDTFQQKVLNGRILQIQLDQFLMAFPAFIPESIRTVRIRKVAVEPIFVGRVLPFFNDILEIAEASANVIEDAV